MTVTFENMQGILAVKYPELKIKEITLDDFVFEQRVRHKCYHCKNYGVKWTCPPRLPNVDYPTMFAEYNHFAVVICEVYLNDEDFEEKRRKSTNLVHRALLYLEGELYNHNECMALSFIGGSCKLCKGGCNKEHCANPYISRIPWEATGCNVIKSLANIGVDVTFPIKDTLHRYGLIMW
jgi:predicted metal-binding protein